MDDTKKFLSLGNFLFVQEEDIHTLVAAIEKNGIYKLGRSGIPRLFSPDSKVALEAFSHLALYLNDLQIIDLGDEDTSEKKGFSDVGLMNMDGQKQWLLIWTLATRRKIERFVL